MVACGSADKQKPCGIQLVGKNTTNLRSHLRSKHKKVYDALVEAEKLKEAAAGSSQAKIKVCN